MATNDFKNSRYFCEMFLKLQVAVYGLKKDINEFTGSLKFSSSEWQMSFYWWFSLITEKPCDGFIRISIFMKERTAHCRME